MLTRHGRASGADTVSVLDEIIATTRAQIAAIPAATRAELEAMVSKPDLAPVRDFAAALTPPTGSLGLIAEIKRRSPSKGDLAPDLDPAVLAGEYATGGATALSVLTDRPYFGGSLEDLVAARAAVGVPVLRKDFMVDPVQLAKARLVGADAVLLIVAVLDDELLADLHTRALELGLHVLVEVHDDAELDRALAIEPSIVGINARDLGDFSEDLGLNERLASHVPDGVVRVAESAIRSRDDAERMAAAGFDALLVGEALVRADDTRTMVRSLATVARRR